MNEKLKSRYRAAKLEFDAQVAKVLLEDSNKSYRQVAKEFEISVDWVIRVAKQHGVKRPRGRKQGIPNKNRAR
jgi:uncharacterized protein YdbL (DUF1318 family)